MSKIAAILSRQLLAITLVSALIWVPARVDAQLFADPVADAYDGAVQALIGFSDAFLATAQAAFFAATLM